MDREKVIKGLEMCKIDFCDECPYDDEKLCTLALKQGALDLIEEMRNKISELNLNRERVIEYLKENPSKSCTECPCFINQGDEGVWCLISGDLTTEVDELMYQHGRSKNCEVL